MTDNKDGQLRLELVGKRAETWNRVFDGLAGIVEQCVKNATEKLLDEDDRVKAASAARDIASMAGDWARARIEKPTLENELILADIAKRFEEVRPRSRARGGALSFERNACIIGLAKGVWSLSQG